jgi:hypothetical protein
MIIAVNEPQAEYKVSGWLPKYIPNSNDDFLYCIENDTIMFYLPFKISHIQLKKNPKRKLSSLRGRLSKQSNSEIDDQISNLRNEWDRNI